MEEELQPSLGRIVLFKYSGGLQVPAVITALNEDGTINLFVFDSTGSLYNIQYGEADGQWDWLPYTKQAAGAKSSDSGDDEEDEE